MTVCLPTYNRAAYLRLAIASALAQTYQDFELWIFDNASDDDTADLVFALKDGRVRYVRRDANIGLTANWMGALQAARAKYCAILGDDDVIDASFLERLVAPLEADPEVDIAFCDHWMIDDCGELLAALTEQFSSGYVRASLEPGIHRPFRSLVLRDQAILINAAVIRRERLLEARALEPRSGRVLDFYMLARLAELGGGAFYVKDRLYAYRRHAGSMTTTQPLQIWRDMQWVCADLVRRAVSTNDVAALRKKWAQAIVNEVAASRNARGAGVLPATLVKAFAAVPRSDRLPVAAEVLVDVLRKSIRKRSGAPPAVLGGAHAHS